MYVSGTLTTFKNRLHQFAKTTGDLTSFASEASGYKTVLTFIEKSKLNREAKRRVPAFSGDLFA